MDGTVFDSLARRLSAARSRRQALATLAGTALVGLGLREAAAQDVVIAGCRSLLQKCDRRGQCCGVESNRDIECDRLSRRCNTSGLNGKRCCGARGAKCGDDCDCCRGYRCKGTTCRG